MRFAAIILLLASTVLASPAPNAKPEAAPAPAPNAEPKAELVNVEALEARIAALEARLAEPAVDANSDIDLAPRDPKGGGGKGGSGGSKTITNSGKKKVIGGGGGKGNNTSAAVTFEPNRVLQVGALTLGVVEIVRLWG